MSCNTSLSRVGNSFRRNRRVRTLLLGWATCYLVSGVAIAAPPVAGETLTLAQALDIAVKQSDDLAAVRAVMARAEAARRRAVGAMIPNLSGQATYILNDQEVANGNAVIVPRHNGSGSMTMSMTLFDGRAIPGLMAANDQLDAARANVDDARTALRFSVADAYITVLAAEALVQVNTRSIAAREQQLEAAEARLNLKLGIAADVSRARAAVYRARRERVGAVAQAAAARDALASLLGLTPPLEATLVRPELASGSIPAEAGARSTALAERRDLDALALNQRAAERLRLATWLSFLPTVQLSGNMSIGRETFANPDGVQFQMTLQLTWLLYDGGIRYAQLKEDAAAIREAQANRRIRERQVVTAVRTALRNAEAADAAIKAATAEEQASRETVEGTTAAFAVGRATGLEVLEAQLALEQVQVERVREELNALRARLELRRALGEMP